jgi:SsrA-binding protein
VRDSALAGLKACATARTSLGRPKGLRYSLRYGLRDGLRRHGRAPRRNLRFRADGARRTQQSGPPARARRSRAVRYGLVARPSGLPTMADKTEREKAQSNIAENRKAFHDFHLLETFEAGLVLLGTEVKAIREGRVNLRDSFARVEDGEVFLYNVNISPYSHRGYADHEPLRRRKLLLHRDEIRKLIGKTVEKGMTLVPTRLYFKNGKVKVAVSLAKGKKDYDKRETIKRREADRETRAAIKSRR